MSALEKRVAFQLNRQLEAWHTAEQYQRREVSQLYTVLQRFLRIIRRQLASLSPTSSPNSRQSSEADVTSDASPPHPQDDGDQESRPPNSPQAQSMSNLARPPSHGDADQESRPSETRSTSLSAPPHSHDDSDQEPRPSNASSGPSSFQARSTSSSVPPHSHGDGDQGSHPSNASSTPQTRSTSSSAPLHSHEDDDQAQDNEDQRQMSPDPSIIRDSSGGPCAGDTSRKRKSGMSESSEPTKRRRNSIDNTDVLEHCVTPQGRDVSKLLLDKAKALNICDGLVGDILRLVLNLATTTNFCHLRDALNGGLLEISSCEDLAPTFVAAQKVKGKKLIGSIPYRYYALIFAKGIDKLKNDLAHARQRRRDDVRRNGTTDRATEDECASYCASDDKRSSLAVVLEHVARSIQAASSSTVPAALLREVKLLQSAGSYWFAFFGDRLHLLSLWTGDSGLVPRGDAVDFARHAIEILKPELLQSPLSDVLTSVTQSFLQEQSPPPFLLQAMSEETIEENLAKPEWVAQLLLKENDTVNPQHINGDGPVTGESGESGESDDQWAMSQLLNLSPTRSIRHNDEPG